MKTALVYDRVNQWGGAERVLVELSKLFPEAPLFTSVYAPQRAGWAKSMVVKTSFVDKLPFSRTNHEAYVMLMPQAFESFDFSGYDLIISVTSAEAKGIITKPDQLHICYLLTPTRYLWSHSHFYRGKGISGAVKAPFMSKLRRWDYLAGKRPDRLIAISEVVKKRAEKYYRRKVHSVIYPPVNTGYFGLGQPMELKEKDYFLMVGRLVGYKGVGPVVEAFRGLPKEKLIVVGSGRKLGRLRRKAPGNVTVLGPVTEEKLRQLYRGAKALIYPQEEDFGITAVEAQAAGTPVLALNQGGARETVIEGKSGLFFEKAEPQEIAQMVARFKNHTFYDKTIRQGVERFDKDRFTQIMSQTIEELWQKHQKRKNR